MATMSRQEVARLLVATGHAHHAAYAAADGVDPEWASWYAPYLQAQLGDGLGRKVNRSELIYLLVRSEREHDDADDGSEWQDYYAGVILKG